MAEKQRIYPPKPAVLSISSHVVRGSVGNRAAVFALETLGFPVWAIPTVTLPWHPGHGPSTRLVPPDDDFENCIEDISRAPWLDEIGGILTGYMANAAQVKTIAILIAKLKQANPELVYLCDPVIGDTGGLYVAEETASAIRDHLLPLADIATPNRFELGWLLNTEAPETVQKAIKLAPLVAPARILVTSCPGKGAKEIGNLYCDEAQTLMAIHDGVNNPPNGLGDLTAALFLAHSLDGIDASDCLKRTTASVLEILEHSIQQGSNELALESNATSLRQSKVEISVTCLTL